MLRKNGFTLVELLAVIVIIGIIIGIAVPSYIGITKSTNDKMYESKISTIEAKAESYASDYNIETDTISVAKLIEEGYLEPDNTNAGVYEEISNPKGGYLDCYIVNINKVNGEYNITVTENNDCLIANNDAITSKINVYAYTYSNGKIGTSLGANNNITWSNQDVLLYADMSEVTNELVNDNITWTVGTSSNTKTKSIITGANANYQNYSNEELVSASVFLDNEYTMTFNLKNGFATKKVEIKIDKEKPYVDTSVDDKWTTGNKTVTLTGSDGTGSGITKFYVSKTNTTPSSSVFNINASNNTASASLDVGEYYAYSLDMAGNVSDAKKFIITNIDKTGPICKYAVVPSTYTYNNVAYPWSHNNITITYGCSTDSASGCKTLDTTKTYTSAVNETINWTIEDNLGNKTNCSQALSIKIDKTTPTITAKSNPISLGNQDYDFKNNLNITFGAGSGNTVCDPAVSKKTGSYNVKCTATGNNGLISSVTFAARHSYTGTYHYVSKTCDGERNCNSCDSCSCVCGLTWCWFEGKLVGDRCCGCDVTCHTYRCCDHYTYDCSYGYYTCDNGGSLSGSTCYY